MKEVVYIDQPDFRLTSSTFRAKDQTFDVGKIESVEIKRGGPWPVILSATGLAVGVLIAIVGRNGYPVLLIVGLLLMIMNGWLLYRLLKVGATSTLSILVSGRKHRIYEGPSSNVESFREEILKAISQTKRT